MTIEAHLEALQRKHVALEEEISDTMARPAPDQAAVTRLKREKLHIKEEIERLRTAETTH